MKAGADAGPQIRLLSCLECRTVDEIPDYEGDPAQDTLLQISIERHTDPVTQLTHVGNLYRIPVKYWSRSDVRHRVLKSISSGSSEGLAAIDADFYDTRSTFFDDAMACYRQHLSPKGRCPDWHADNKRLLPKTQADRKEAGIKSKVSETGPRVYLCQFCPANVYMVTKARKEAGQYDRK